jgi:prepilin-type N-terminal cleavage/methylation domain-containing protein
MRSNHSKLSGRAGFTLIELMVAIGVTALLVSLMLTITINVMGGWNKSSGSLTSGNQARLVLDMLSRDLQGLVMKQDGNVWLAATIQQDQTGGGDSGVVGAVWSPRKPSGTASSATDTSGSFYMSSNLEDCRFGQAGTWLRFFTSVTDTNTAAGTNTHISAPRAVAYQIVRLPVVYVTTGGAEYRYQLFRSEVNSNNTFTAGYDISNSNYTSTTETSDLVGAGIIRNPEVSSRDRSLIIANNVIDLGVKFYVREADPTSTPTPGLLSNRLIFPAAAANAPDAITGKPSVPLTGAFTTQTSGAQLSHFAKSVTPSSSDYYRNSIPDVVEIMVRVLTDEGVNQIALFENPPSGYVTPAGTTWWDIALKHSKVFTRRIELNANGL